MTERELRLRGLEGLLTSLFCHLHSKYEMDGLVELGTKMPLWKWDALKCHLSEALDSTKEAIQQEFMRGKE
jgi:hypothetical protein